ncbi:hypothetical protein PoB_007066100 [Plakobranchus ocellatus]|uniref:Uncharacterized protein n=1 Tax=Plakobranchus ocellatus TaxID=259542 RepID=A0AAV4DJ22_9GAST|nr:hypothetical protein PoB_007066100 [Plakobranchus ocellatus]
MTFTHSSSIKQGIQLEGGKGNSKINKYLKSMGEICLAARSVTLSPWQRNKQLRQTKLDSNMDMPGAGGGARERDRRIPADIRADSLAPVPPTPPLLTLEIPKRSDS